ncbi:MAG: tryptophan--tRNA ligase [Nitrososphaeraceae archaeon]
MVKHAGPQTDRSQEEEPEGNEDIFSVTPWEVEGHVDYDKLIDKFGTEAISPSILDSFRSITGEIHPLLSLEYFYSHRDLDWILEKYRNGERFYLYTGRGPSGMVHMGHIMPWLFSKYLQEKFNSKLIFQLTDDEKFLFNQDLSKERIDYFTHENILDIIATGFDPNKTKILVDSKHIQYLYPIATEIARHITFSTAKAVFGFSNSSNIGMIGFPPIQASTCFLPSVIEKKPTPVLIPAAIDQDPYWRVTRDVATKLGYYKPAQIHSKFVPGLGISGKMSSSKPDTALFTTDSPEIIDKKILSAFTGGQATVELQRKLGGNPNVCPVFWYLRYFFDTERESDERFLKCKIGNLLCGECKADLTNAAKPFIANFQKRREKAEDSIKEFMYDNDSSSI